MEIYRFVREYYKKHPEGHFFDRETLKFFGERMSEMKILKEKVKVTDERGREHTCYVLSSIQRPPFPPYKMRKHHYFDVDTLDDVIVAR